MGGKRARAFVWTGMMCLLTGVFVGCGHEQEKGAEYEQQSYQEEADESSSVWQYGSTENTESEIAAESDPDPKQEESQKSDVDSGMGTKRQEQEMNAESSENTVAADSEEVTMESVATEQDEKQVEIEESEGSQERSETPEDSIEIPQESNMAGLDLYYLTEQDKEEVMAQLILLGENYGLTFHSSMTEGETWDSPTPIYEEDMRLGREHVLRVMVEYSEGAFALMQMEGCEGFALAIKEKPNTITDAYYEVYVYWV